MLVGGEVPVDQPPHEVPRSGPPLDGCRSLTRKLAASIRIRLCTQPLGPELAHAGVDDRIAGAPVAPRGEAAAWFVVFHPCEPRLEALAGGAGVPPENVGEELPPRQLGPVRRGALTPLPAEVGQQRAGVDCAPLQVHRHPRGAVEVGAINNALPSRCSTHSRQRRCAADSPAGWEARLPGRSVEGWSLLRGRTHETRRGGIDGAGQPCSRQAREYGVNIR